MQASRIAWVPQRSKNSRWSLLRRSSAPMLLPLARVSPLQSSDRSRLPMRLTARRLRRVMTRLTSRRPVTRSSQRQAPSCRNSRSHLALTANLTKVKNKKQWSADAASVSRKRRRLSYKPTTAMRASGTSRSWPNLLISQASKREKSTSGTTTRNRRIRRLTTE